MIVLTSLTHCLWSFEFSALTMLSTLSDLD